MRTRVEIPAASASQKASISSLVLRGEKLTRREQSASRADRPCARSEALTFCPCEAHADPEETQIPFAERKFSMVCDLISGRVRLISFNAWHFFRFLDL